MQTTETEWFEEDKPKSDFRSLKREGTKSTIAMAFRCKDGVFVSADMRGSDEDGMVDDIQKIFPVGKSGVVAFSGDDYDWIRKFVTFLDKPSRKAKSDVEIVTQSVHDYHSYLEKHYPKMFPTRSNFAAILATFDTEPHIYEFTGTKTPIEETEHGRLFIGLAGRTAKVYIRTVEFLMRLIPLSENQTHYGWPRFSMKVVGRFCDNLMATLPTYESTVLGKVYYTVSKTGRKRIMKEEDLLGEDFLRRPFPSFISAVLDEIPTSYLAAAVNNTNAVPEAFKEALLSLAKDRAAWD